MLLSRSDASHECMTAHIFKQMQIHRFVQIRFDRFVQHDRTLIDRIDRIDRSTGNPNQIQICRFVQYEICASYRRWSRIATKYRSDRDR